jgi:hypothetical protein
MVKTSDLYFAPAQEGQQSSFISPKPSQTLQAPFSKLKLK